MKAKLLFMGEDARNRLLDPPKTGFTAQAESIEPEKENEGTTAATTAIIEADNSYKNRK